MVRSFLRWLLAGVLTFGWGWFAASAEDGEGDLVQVRAVLLDPARPPADLYMQTKSGGLERLQLLVGGLSPPLEVIPQEGFLVLYKTADIDPADPPPGAVAASAPAAECRPAHGRHCAGRTGGGKTLSKGSHR